jgi:tripartite-type tricarboxylate transporter receptor subunit TctC
VAVVMRVAPPVDFEWLTAPAMVKLWDSGDAPMVESTRKGTEVPNSSRTRRFSAACAGLLLVGAGLTGCGSTDSSGPGGPQPYYKGKTIEIIGTSSPGGGSDTAARLLAEFLQRNIDGNPKVQVVNMQGAGGLEGGNTFVERKSDGLSLLMVSSTATLPAIVGGPQVKYNLADMTSVFFVPSAKVAYTRADTGITGIAQLSDPPVPLTNPGTTPSGNDVDVSAMFEALGVLDKMRTVYGYDGSAEAAQSVVSGETNFNTYGVGSMKRSFQGDIDNGTLKLLFATGVPDGKGGLTPDPNLPDLPTAADAYRILRNGAEPSGDAWKAFMMLREVQAYAMISKSDIPDEAMAALDEGVAKSVTDKDFLASLWKASPYGPVGGEPAKQWTDTLGSLDPSVVEWLRNFIAKQLA